jgi:RNA polymerase sigma-70 factor (ECF subfamily)
MSFLLARLPARLGGAGHDGGELGELVPLDEQDRSSWDRGLIAQGFVALDRSAAGDRVSEFHLEAAIAAKHAAAPSVPETDWSGILDLYDKLAGVRPTPVVALNRAVALGQVHGPVAALAALDELERQGRLAGYPFLAAARAEFHRRAGELPAARRCLRQAAEQARSELERRFFERRLAEVAAVASLPS